MTILGSELQYYRSKTVSGSGSNGGRISTTRETSGLTNSLWPNYTDGELTSGSTLWRKGFLRIANANNETANNVVIGLWQPLPEADAIYLASGTQTDIQSDLTDPDLYGCGQLNTSATSGSSILSVLVEDGDVVIFRDGERIRISDQTTLGDPTTGNAEYLTISGTPTILGDIVTITTTTAILNDYSSTNTYVSSVIDAGTVEGTVIDKAVTSSSGTFDETEVTVGNLGSLYQIVTLTFTSETSFTATSDEVVFSPNTGSINSVYAPENDSSQEYFNIPVTSYGGTFNNGDTIVFTTVPPCVPIWEKRVLPASTTNFALEARTLMFFAES